VIELARALAEGELHVLGRLPDASNLAMLCEVMLGDRPRRCIYKPAAGERPLWDFPGAVLAGREVLTAVVAHAFGWDLLPETTWRTDGPAGPGMCQEWIDRRADAPVGLFAGDAVPEGWCEVAEGRAPDGEPIVLAHADSDDLKRMVILDALVNNGDRKGGHVLRRPDGRIVGIDHGVTFHAEPKLRTVLWGWTGQPIPKWLVQEVQQGAESFEAALSHGSARLSAAELAAAEARLADLLDSGCFPEPGPDWPALPWPPM
jgi:uncharacterized repeat protein (TIGR03843 family)